MACFGALWGMVMTPEQRELAEAFVELAGWDWMDGIKWGRYLDDGEYRDMGRVDGYRGYIQTNNEALKVIPDLSDPLTVCAIELRCRELWGETFHLFPGLANESKAARWRAGPDPERLRGYRHHVIASAYQRDPDWRARCLFDALRSYVAPVEGGG